MFFISVKTNDGINFDEYYEKDRFRIMRHRRWQRSIYGSRRFLYYEVPKLSHGVSVDKSDRARACP